MRSIVLLPAVLLAGCASASAQPAAQACPKVAEPWKTPRAIASASDVAGAARTPSALGEAIRFSLHPDGEVAYATLPQGAGEAESFGGMASFSIEGAGIYSVGLSESIWVDVEQDGRPVEAVHFGPGSACSGIRKTVSFELAPGTHVIELSGSTVPEVGVLITPVP